MRWKIRAVLAFCSKFITYLILFAAGQNLPPRSDYRIVKEEIHHADIEDAVVVIPPLSDVVAHDNLRERVAGQGEGPAFSGGLLLRPQGVGGLDVGLFAASGGDKIDLYRRRKVNGQMRTSAYFFPSSQ